MAGTPSGTRSEERSPRTCVFCGSAPLGTELAALARALGRSIAESGDDLVYGGTMTGLMADVASGARDAGGRVIGIVPAAISTLGSVDRRADELVEVETMGQRKVAMLEGVHRVVVLPGGLGTLDELLEVLTMRQLGLVPATTDVVLLDPTDHFHGLVELFDRLVDAGAVRRGAAHIRRVARVEQALRPPPDDTPGECTP